MTASIVVGNDGGNRWHICRIKIEFTNGKGGGGSGESTYLCKEGVNVIDNYSGAAA